MWPNTLSLSFVALKNSAFASCFFTTHIASWVMQSTCVICYKLHIENSSKTLQFGYTKAYHLQFLIHQTRGEIYGV